jgi:hypothetical protein
MGFPKVEPTDRLSSVTPREWLKSRIRSFCCHEHGKGWPICYNIRRQDVFVPLFPCLTGVPKR